jgi:predicted glycosyltransferase
MNNAPQPNPVVLFQPQNHVGLGHLNRLSAIALALREIAPSVRTPFVVEGPSHVLLDALRLPYAPLPSSHLMYETDEWSAWDGESRRQLCIEMSRAIVGALMPQVVVFDSFPNEAFASVVLAANLPIILCLRQAKDMERYLARLAHFIPHAHRILIPHEKGTFELPAELAVKSRFVGEIVRPFESKVTSKRSRDAAQVVIHGGGGGYPGTVDFFNIAIQAAVALRISRPNLKVRLITGPLFTDWLNLRVGPALSLVPFDPDLNATLAKADIVICQAGYNTIAELKRIATRVLVVPAERRWDDQLARSEAAAKANLHFRVVRAKTPHELACAAEEFLREPAPKLSPSLADGARNAAEIISELLRIPGQASE